MHRTKTSVRPQSGVRLAELQQERPEWRNWLQLLGEAGRALERESTVVGLEELGVGSRESGVPLLHGRTIRVDAGSIHELLRRLLAIAAGGDLDGLAALSGYKPTVDQTLRLIGAAVRQDRELLARVSNEAGVDQAALTSVAHLAALPILQGCRRLLRDRVLEQWSQGYCPVCGAWPIMAERRGLDRTRRLRCGRCAGEWQAQWLSCIYCGERDHNRLGSLVPDEKGERLKVETCSTCRGYLKSTATLQEIPAFELLLQDLETVELDLVALERGYGRPEESGFGLIVEVVGSEA